MLANTYDAAWAVALAIEHSLKESVSLDFDTDDGFGVKQVVGGQQFMEQLRRVNFQGVSGYLKMQNDSTREPRLVACNLCREYTN